MNFVFITDPKVLAIPIIECHEPLVDVKQYPELSYGPVPESELTKDDYTKMRQTVFEKLCMVQNNLPHGWRLRLYEGFRSLAVQEMLFEQKYQVVCKQFPHLNTEQLFYETTRLVSPVTHLDGSLNIPPHNTGAAVDVELVTAEGRLVDMGMEAKDWVQVKPELCQTDYADLSAEVKQNRHILQACMEAQGFVNYPTEWWHFSYGDRYWAYVRGEPCAMYGSIIKLN